MKQAVMTITTVNQEQDERRLEKNLCYLYILYISALYFFCFSSLLVNNKCIKSSSFFFSLNNTSYINRSGEIERGKTIYKKLIELRLERHKYYDRIEYTVFLLVCFYHSQPSDTVAVYVYAISNLLVCLSTPDILFCKVIRHKSSMK